MSDVNTWIIEPFTKFCKDSSYLVKKCTKPDHKGDVLYEQKDISLKIGYNTLYIDYIFYILYCILYK